MRPRRDPRAERLGHQTQGAGRPRFDWAASPVPKRPRRDPRHETPLAPSPNGRLRLDRAGRPVTGAAPTEIGAVARPKPEPIRVEDAALRILVVADPGADELTAHDRQCLAVARRWVGGAGGVVLAVDRPVPEAGACGADRVLVLTAFDHPASRFEAVLRAWESLALPHVLVPETEAGGDLARRLAGRTGRSFFAGVEGVGADGTMVRAVSGRSVDQLMRDPAIAPLIPPPPEGAASPPSRDPRPPPRRASPAPPWRRGDRC